MGKAARSAVICLWAALVLAVSAEPLHAGGMALRCAGDRYALGDSVIAILTNETDSTFVIGGLPCYVIIESGSGDTTMPSSCCYPVDWSVRPHESVRIAWDQFCWRFCMWDGHWASAGLYEMGVLYWNDTFTRKWYVSDQFEIFDPLPVRTMTWGYIKREWRSGWRWAGSGGP
jgi:hypothetical protein